MTDEQAAAQRILDAVPGTYEPIPGRAGWYWVKGSEMVYELTLGSESQPASCECPDRVYRGTVCKHLRGLERLETGWPSAAEEISEWNRLTEDQKKAVFR